MRAIVRVSSALSKVVVLGLLLWAGAVGHAATANDTLEITSKSGVHVFTVEMAASDADRSRGLMFRKSLPAGHGMLFDFKQDQVVGMWMRNTYVSLDMIFIRADGTIARIAQNTEPLSERVISSGVAVRAVFEVVAGTARRLGLAAGDRVAHPMFRR
jgi:uncharacterized membrane protein (UPF0127 family)